jgi:hypothetical protein
MGVVSNFVRHSAWENRLRDALPPVAGQARSLRKALLFSAGPSTKPGGVLVTEKPVLRGLKLCPHRAQDAPRRGKSGWIDVFLRLSAEQRLEANRGGLGNQYR